VCLTLYANTAASWVKRKWETFSGHCIGGAEKETDATDFNAYFKSLLMLVYIHTVIISIIQIGLQNQKLL